MWLDDGPEDRVGRDRIKEITATGTGTVVVSCPFCRTMFGDGLAAADSPTNVVDLAELLINSLEETG